MRAVMSPRPSLSALQRLASWLALVAILLSAVLPMRAAPVDDAMALLGLDICSAAKAGTRDQPDAPASHTNGEHCSACWLGHPVALPPAPLVALTQPRLLLGEAPALFFSAPRRLHAWVSAPSRAPPARV
jgi:hypothetical protein